MILTSYQRLGMVAFLGLAAVYLFFLNDVVYPVTTMLKPLPIYALLFVVAVAPMSLSSKTILIGALSLSSLGDIALTLPVSRQLELGLCLFLMAHLCYISIFHQSQTENDRQWVLVPFLAVGLFYGAVLIINLWPSLGDKRIPIILYMGVLLTMSTLAVKGHWLCAAGGVLFIASDSLIAFDEFVIHMTKHSFAVMLTYYTAQCFLVIGLLQQCSLGYQKAPTD